MLTTRRVLDTFKQIGITHVVGLPDNSTAALFHDSLKTQNLPHQRHARAKPLRQPQGYGWAGSHPWC